MLTVGNEASSSQHASAITVWYSVAVKLLSQLYEDIWLQYHRLLKPLLFLIVAAVAACPITSLLLLASCLS
jgi:hypothetical protein